MKASLRHLLIPFALFATRALASDSDIEISRRAEDDADLEEWLAAAKRVSPDALKKCPVSCSKTGNNTSSAGWFLFPDAAKLASCNETMLLSMVVQRESEDKNTQTVIRACTANYDSGVKLAFVPDEKRASLCSTPNRVLEEASIYMHQPQAGSNDAEFSVNHLLSAGRQITSHLALQMPSCTNNAMEFVHFQSSVIGIFAGAEIHQHGVTYVEPRAAAQITALELLPAAQRIFPFIQEAVKSWAGGRCVSQADAGEPWMSVTLRVPVPVEAKSNNSTDVTPESFATTPAHLGARSRLSIRADCRTVKVKAGDGCWAVADRCKISQSDLKQYNRANLCSTLIVDEVVCCSSGTLPSTLPPGNADGTCKIRAVISGDSCGSLASKCGISAADFMKVNPKPNLCSTLAEGQRVCCSKGKMPDLKPKPDANGNCATYMTKKDDNCSKIAAARDLNVTALESFNKKTWGWNGCKLLYPDFKMCVSTGSPPMPANVIKPVANSPFPSIDV
ncbi:hypothetical protein DL771_007943 [Monosporascus sp. 5C6A]|nr:hypothetical protein DL771_007943 [Monosporascus sp. 5C6A]